jgi:hypothetical protein
MFEARTNPPDDKPLCIYCDADEIREEAIQKARDRAKEYNIENPASQEDEKTEDDFLDECLEELNDEYGECKSCYLEDHADDWDDDF